MSKAKAMLCVSFVLAFAAGICAGLLFVRSMSVRAPGSVLSRELDLTPKQREQMRQIWSEVTRASAERQPADRDAIRKRRDEAVKALLTSEQMREYEQLMEQYARELDALSQERRTRFDEAVEKTKLILTEPQRRKYTEMLERGARRPRRGGRPGENRSESSQSEEE